MRLYVCEIFCGKVCRKSRRGSHDIVVTVSHQVLEWRDIVQFTLESYLWELHAECETHWIGVEVIRIP